MSRQRRVDLQPHACIGEMHANQVDAQRTDVEGQPELDDWLVSLSMMSTFEQYFSAGELKRVFERWLRCKSEWPPLLQAVRERLLAAYENDTLLQAGAAFTPEVLQYVRQVANDT